MNDVSLTFDPSGFIAGVNKMTQSMTSFDTKMSGSDKSAVKSVDKMSSFMVAKGMLLAQVITGLASKAWGAITKNIPEIGKTFEIAGDIISRNLLWPLRQELIPILQNILNWVRDHRAMFVRLGEVIANVFRAVITIVKTFFGMVERVFTRLFNGLSKIFGVAKLNIEKILNVLIFKITAVYIFLMAIMEPVFNFIVDSLITAAGWVEKFFDGFSKGMKGASPAFADLIHQLERIIDLLMITDGKTSLVGKAFEGLGWIIGKTVKLLVEGLVDSLDAIAGLVSYMSLAKMTITGDKAGASALRKQMDREKEMSFRRQIETYMPNATQAEKNKALEKAGYSPSQTKTASPASGGNTTNNTSNTVNVSVVAPQGMSAHDLSRAVQSGTVNALKETQMRRGQ